MKPSCLLALFLAAVPAAQTSPVRTVGPAGEFTNLQDALAAANDGDVLLVEPGRYLMSAPLVIGRPLSIVADGGPVILASRVIVTGLQAGASVHLQGFVIENRRSRPAPRSSAAAPSCCCSTTRSDQESARVRSTSARHGR